MCLYILDNQKKTLSAFLFLATKQAKYQMETKEMERKEIPYLASGGPKKTKEEAGSIVLAPPIL